jgi:hypothetical protein
MGTLSRMDGVIVCLDGRVLCFACVIPDLTNAPGRALFLMSIDYFRKLLRHD